MQPLAYNVMGLDFYKQLFNLSPVNIYAHKYAHNIFNRNGIASWVYSMSLYSSCSKCLTNQSVNQYCITGQDWCAFLMSNLRKSLRHAKCPYTLFQSVEKCCPATFKCLSVKRCDYIVDVISFVLKIWLSAKYFKMNKKSIIENICKIRLFVNLHNAS